MKTNSTSRSAFFNPRLLIGFALCSLGILLSVVGWSKSVTGTIATKAPAQAPGTWQATGSLATARYLYTATLLPNGQVLVAGGGANCFFCDVLASAELYDPVSGMWTVTGSLATARREHTATLLPNGKVLVAGGYNGDLLSSAELYDPATGLWTRTGSMATARYSHSATLLPNGKVLVAGGFDSGFNGLASAELYDPATGLGPRRAAWPPGDTPIPRRSCPMARCSSLGGGTLSRARNSMIRRPGYGLRRAAWPPGEPPLPRRSCPMARCSSLGDLAPGLLARNSMIRRPGCGPRRAA